MTDEFEDLDLAKIGMVDGPSDEALDRLTALASELCNTPVALISMVQEDRDRQFFTSALGLPEPWAARRETPLSHSFCQYVKSTAKPFVVPDALEHPLVKDTLAIPDLGVRAYLGVPILDPNGSAIGALCAIDETPRHWTEGNIRQLTVLADAISVHVKMRFAILASEERGKRASLFGRIVRKSYHEVFVVDAESMLFVDANMGALENLGYSLSELKSKTPLGINPEYDQSKLRAVIAPLLAGEVTEVQFDTVHQRKDGSCYPAAIRLELHQDVSHKLLVAFCKDVTQKQQLERRLREETEHFEALFRYSPDAITVSDADTTIRMANTAYEKMMGQSAQDMIGDKFSEHIPKDQRQAVLAQLSGLSPKKRVMVNLQQQVINGEQHSILWKNVALFDGKKQDKIISIGRDVTPIEEARKVAEAIAQDEKSANNMKSAFLANMSHEVRTPLNAMMGLFQIIEMSEVEPEIKLHATTGLAAGQGMVRQLDNVLDVSRIEANAVKLLRKSVLIAPLVARWRDIAVGAVKRQKKRIDVQTSIDDALPAEVYLDSERTTQVVMNLCDNAAKFTQEGEIVISIEPLSPDNPLGTGIKIGVFDTGIGIPTAQTESIFERFTQIDTSITRQQSGTGLGLSISRDLANMMGGQLQVESPSKRGRFATHFSLSLPMPANNWKENEKTDLIGRGR